MTTQTASKFRLGTPQTSGPLAVYPVFGPEPRLRYRTLAQAVDHGAFVTEVDEHGSVNDVQVCNASDQPVLLYEGELIIGARQNRTIDQPVLVPAGVELNVPVSCVEQGRWEAGRRTERFHPSPHALDPELRRTKRATANRTAPGLEARPAQGEVWHAVTERLSQHGVASPSAAFTDLFDAKRPDLDELKRPIHAIDEQIGAVVEISGRPVALDLVSRPEAFADLLPRLVDGYALQALQDLHRVASPACGHSDEAAEEFLALVIASRRRWLPTPGMGDAFAPTRRRIYGSGLTAERELVALSAFPAVR
jgi:hypothetical protein